MAYETVCISGIWLRRIGDKVQVLAESKGVHGRHWFLVIEEHAEGSFSHIAESGGILNAPIDPLAALSDELRAKDNARVEAIKVAGPQPQKPRAAD
jgi:hypothetical protein